MFTMTPLERWVEAAAGMTRPDRVVWCDGSEAEHHRLIEGMLADGTLLPMNEQTNPNSYLHRSDPNDVARTEHLTFICSRTRAEAGPNNNWMAPAEAKERVGKLFEGSMRGRTMYVIPYLMGAPGSLHTKVGVEVTDSPYVVANMRIMTKMGQVALDQLGGSEEFSPGLHSMGDLSPDRRYILHFPEERLVWSIGSGYGGTALLGKKCLSLRLASWMAREEGWLAEHMMILGLEDPSGAVTYMAGAFPSACGKTNLAMLVSPLADQGYRVWTVGDGICWMRIGADGRLWAVNPENGFFGVAPGTSAHTNPNAMATLASNSIFTNVGLTPDGQPWWEGPALSTGRATRGSRATAWSPTPTRASPRPPNSAPRSRRTGRTRKACRSRPSCSAGAVPAWRPWSIRRSIGSTGCSSAPAWPRRLPPRLPARWV